MPQTETQTVTAECGCTLPVGSKAFSHYTCKVGVIGQPDKFDGGWFFFTYPDGTRDLLNGERVACIACAKRYGWNVEEGAPPS